MVHASTIYVPDDQPTIQAGIDAAAGGDFVLVAPGTYVESIDFLGKAITLRSVEGAAETIIDGNQSGSVVTFAGGEGLGTVIDDFTIRNGSGTYYMEVPGGWLYYGGGMFCSGASPMIANCTISSNSADKGGGIGCIDQAGPTIARCTISDNNASYTGGGINGDPFSDLYVVNSTISANTSGYFGGGVYLLSASSTIMSCLITDNSADNGGGLYIGLSVTTDIVNCTITDNSAIGIYGTGGGIYCDWDGGKPIITNSILWGNSAVVSEPHYGMQFFGPAIFSYSDVEGGAPGIGCLDLNPFFIGGGDYHLSPGSPCIDAGVTLVIAVDIDTDPRPQGCGFDLGADENVDCHDCDGDHYPDEGCGGGDCDDSNPRIHPGADEFCWGGLDEDCDGLIDDGDPDCPVEFTLELDASYDFGFINLDFTLGAVEPALWIASLVATFPTVQFFPLWADSIPAIEPPMEMPITFAYPGTGWVVIYSSLYTEAGVQAETFDLFVAN